jgi:tetratricopeptide (TPR) repeat protein
MTVPLATQAAELNHAREYARCMGLAPSDPNDAFEMATAWKGLGGGDAAEHCAAVALLYSGQAEYAARRLEVLAETIVAEPDFKGQILAQAGQAWLLHGDAPRAEAALTEAVKLLRGKPAVMVDRAQARAAMGDYKGAVEDLTNAISADPKMADAYTFRASAYRYLDELGKARADIEAALLLEPDNPAALLERGILFRLDGKDAAARQDWLRVLALDPDGEAGKLARANIEKMDVRSNQ